MRQNDLPVSFSRAILKPQMNASVLTCIMLLLLSGCRLPGLYSAGPPAPLPADYNGETTEGNSAQVGVMEFFNDPVLTQLITEGLAQNQELKIRNQEIQIAYNEIMARQGAYLPFIGVGARAAVDRTSRYTPLGAAEEQLTFPGGGRFPDPLGNFRLTADLFWHIDIWRQYRNARDAAMQRYCEAIEARNYLITRLVADTAESYYELASLDRRLVFLNQTIELQQQSLEAAKLQVLAARGTELGVQRFLGEVRKNESQKLIVNQRIIEVENRINFLVGRFPQRVERASWDFINLDSQMLNVGVPADLLHNRRDIRAAELEVAASGLDVLVARANFFPKVDLIAGIGFEAFEPRFLFDPRSMVANAAGELTAPLINRRAIRAEYLNANARQLQAIYKYQRTILTAFTEVINSMTKVRNYGRSIEIKQQQVIALEKSVEFARDLFNKPIGEAFARVDYVDILLATRDLLDGRTVLVETKQQQLSAIVNAYQALGGGLLMNTAGIELNDYFCELYENQSYGMYPAPTSYDTRQPLSPVEESQPPAPPQENPPPPPADENAPGAPGKANLPAAPEKESLPPQAKP